MRDGRTYVRTNDEQGKIGLLIQMEAGWLSFATRWVENWAKWKLQLGGEGVPVFTYKTSSKTSTTTKTKSTQNKSQSIYFFVKGDLSSFLIRGRALTTW